MSSDDDGPGKTYAQLYAGDWLPVYMKGQKISCCSCGLVHVFRFRTRNGGLEIQLQVDNRATGQIRRHSTTEITQKKNK